MARGHRAPLLERLGDKSIAGPGGCILFTGALLAGYGQIGNGEYKVVRAHRAAYELLVGPIPEGYDLDHLCHTRDSDCTAGSACLHRRCINPYHLEPVTREENRLRGGMSRKQRCLRGHPFDEANTYWMPNGAGRSCKACLRLRAREAQERKRKAAAS